MREIRDFLIIPTVFLQFSSAQRGLFASPGVFHHGVQPKYGRISEIPIILKKITDFLINFLNNREKIRRNRVPIRLFLRRDPFLRVALDEMAKARDNQRFVELFDVHVGPKVRVQSERHAEFLRKIQE